MTTTPEREEFEADLRILEDALAAGPTPGEWYAADWSNEFGDNLTTIEAREPEVLRPGQSGIWPDGIRHIKVAGTEEASDKPIINAAFIAACSPARIARLISSARQSAPAWDASHIKPPTWAHVEAAFIEGAQDARANHDASDDDFRRAADGYTKRVFEEVDPVSEEALRTASWQSAPESCAKVDDCTESLCMQAHRCKHTLPPQPQRLCVEQSATEGVVIDAYAIPVEDYRTEIKIQRMRQIEGPALWKVARNGDCLNKSGEWEYEPMPSSRDDEFLARCRFDSPEEAIAAAMKA